MAHSQSIRKGQFPLICQICENDTRIKWKCLECDKLMCDNCKQKIHPKFAKDHRIIDIKEVGLHSEETKLDFSQIKCKQHPGQVCCLFCTTCDDHIVCPTCVSKIHKKHDLVEISEGYKMKVEGLKKGLSQFESDKVNMKKQRDKLKFIKTTENTKYTEVSKNILSQEIVVKQAVEKKTQKLINEVDQKWQTIVDTIEHGLDILDKNGGKIEEKSTKTKDLIKSSDVSMFFEEVGKVEKSIAEVIPPFDIKCSTIPNFVPGDTTLNTVGVLQHGEVEDQFPPKRELSIKNEYVTTLAGVHCIVPSIGHSFWICSNLSPGMLQKVKEEDKTLKVISSYNIQVYSMLVTPSHGLLLTTGDTVLKQINERTGELTDTVYSVAPFRITTTFLTGDNQIIVGALGAGSARVIVMDKRGEQQMVYEYDKNNKPIFNYPVGITCTNGGNIFVSDFLSSNKQGHVAVIDNSGNVLNTYTGHPNFNKIGYQFRPRGIESTKTNKVIVTDMDNHFLHILDFSGHLLSYCDTGGSGIFYPCSLHFNMGGQLYIGCSRVITSSETAGKIYKVNISGI